MFIKLMLLRSFGPIICNLVLCVFCFLFHRNRPKSLTATPSNRSPTISKHSKDGQKTPKVVLVNEMKKKNQKEHIKNMKAIEVCILV